MNPDYHHKRKLVKLYFLLSLKMLYDRPMDQYAKVSRAAQRVIAERDKLINQIKASKSKGMRYSHLAVAAGIEPSQLSEILKGKKSFTFTTIEKLRGVQP